jgi:5S rRNA maturation endonuclease (ribonuclease M5)
MGKISDQIRSIRQTVGRDYERPDPSRLDYFTTQLEQNQEAKDYLKTERGLAEDTISHFRLGYDPERDAIAIPTFKSGELINFKYRYLHPDKNRYTSERGAETWIFNEEGIEVGKTKSGVLVVEGEFDLMSAWQVGVKNVVSPASGKDSYGVWLEMLDAIPRVYVAFDNDEGGKETALKFAERVGLEKCFEVKYPTGIKDANQYFKEYAYEDFIGLVKKAQPYYAYQFKGVGDIIESLRSTEVETLELKLVPEVKFEKDWLTVISGKTNVGKTSYILNLARELSEKNVPTLIMPFERGITSVGKRYLQILFKKTADDFQFTSNDEWEKLVESVVDNPTYFAVPKREEITDVIIKAKKIFDTKVVIVDHLDYLVRHVQGNREAEIANTLQNLKRVAEQYGIIIMIVSHIRKIEQAGAVTSRQPNIEDLKGSSSLYQDPECVIMLTSQESNTINVNVVKNKGNMVNHTFGINLATGVMDDNADDF